MERNRKVVSDNPARRVAESLFHRNQRRDAEIQDAMKQERARHDAALRNMNRLKELRQARATEDRKKRDT